MDTQTFLFSPVRAAAFLGCSRSTVYSLLERGQLESVHVGRLRRIPLTSLREFIEEQLDGGS